MTRHLVIAVACIVSLHATTRAAFASDMCTPPRMNVDKWHVVEPVPGMRVSLPPSYGSRATYSHNRHIAFYFADRDREVSLGTGPGPGPRLDPASGMGTTVSVEKLPDGVASDEYASVATQMTQTAQCTTAINGRSVHIVEYRWYGPDAVLSTRRDESALYRLVAHYLPSDSEPDAFVSIESSSQSELGVNRQIFWTASFGRATAASATAPCVPKPDPSLPTSGAVLDTALVQTLLTSAARPPVGFAVLALSFNGGALSGISVAESDLPDSTQRQLATLVASNLAPHDAKAPSAFLLRVETSDAGVRYAVEPVCTP